MSKHALWAIALAFAFIAGNSSLAGADEPLPEEVQFINAYLQAHSAKDLKMALRLISCGNDIGMKKRLQTILAHSFKIPIKSIELVPQNPPPIDKDARGWKAPQPGQPMGKTLVIRFVPNTEGYDSFSFPGELKDGRLLIGTPHPAGEK